jgi:hypothetical protein
MSDLTPRQEIREMERAEKALLKMSAAGQEYIAAWLLRTTQGQLRHMGLRVRALEGWRCG